MLLVRHQLQSLLIDGLRVHVVFLRKEVVGLGNQFGVLLALLFVGVDKCLSLSNSLLRMSLVRLDGQSLFVGVDGVFVFLVAKISVGGCNCLIVIAVALGGFGNQVVNFHNLVFGVHLARFHRRSLIVERLGLSVVLGLELGVGLGYQVVILCVVFRNLLFHNLLLG